MLVIVNCNKPMSQSDNSEADLLVETIFVLGAINGLRYGKESTQVQI